MNAEPPELSIVVPAFNEVLRIGRSLERIVAWAEQRDPRPEILVVDDGSTDATPQLVAMFESRGVGLISLPRNRGKGAALRAGVLASRGARVLITDADLSTPIEQVGRLEPHLREADLVLGSRALSDSRITRRQPLARELSGKLFNLVIRILGVRGIHDTQCGFKLLRGDAARRLFSEMIIERFAFDVELVWLARQRGYRVVEVGVEWQNDPASRVRVVRDGVRMLTDVLRFRRYHRARPGGSGPGGEGHRR